MTIIKAIHIHKGMDVEDEDEDEDEGEDEEDEGEDEDTFIKLPEVCIPALKLPEVCIPEFTGGGRVNPLIRIGRELKFMFFKNSFIYNNNYFML